MEEMVFMSLLIGHPLDRSVTYQQPISVMGWRC
jgi:hypothetical protein